MARLHTLVGLGALAGCAEPAIDVTLKPPPAAVASEFETSCISAVSVYVNGGNYPDNDDEDWNYDCLDLDPDVDRSTFGKLQAAIHGQFQIDLPDSGLGGIEIYGHTGTCNSLREEEFDLIFHGNAQYTGGESLVVQMLPNLSCATSAVTARPINLLKLSATHDCAQAAVTTGRIGLTTLSMLPFTDEMYWWGGLSAGDITAAGVAMFPGRTKVGTSMLTLLHTVDGKWASLAPQAPATQQVCASAAEIEVATIPLAVARASQDPAKIAETDAVAYGLVYGTAGPIAGATVAVSESQRDLAQIVYLDMAPGVENGTGALTPRTGTGTGPSGLFAVYTASMVDVTITAAGKSVQRKLGTASDIDEPPPPVAIIVKL